jgi:3',5'-cyclic AMP phosphodiesterase CpdA
MNLKKSILFILSIIVFASCEKAFDYSPYVIDFDEENSNLNNKNIATIAKQQNDDSVITIAFTGDTHRFFDEFDEFVNSVNKLNKSKQVDFVIHVGDIADFGLPKQYIWGNSYLLKLDVPYFVVIGNHDLVSNGGDAYHEMFGQYDFSFIYDSVKFIAINTNSLEFDNNGNVPNITWLDEQLQPNSSFRKAVVLFHVAPMHSEFDPNLIDAFNQTLAKYHNVLFVAHGHMHDYSVSIPYNNGVSFVNVFGIEHNKFNIIEIENDTFKVDTFSF